MKSNTCRPIRASRISFDLKDDLTHERAVEEILKTVTEVQGNVVHAAAVLEVSYRQLSRWILSYPKLRKQVQAIRVKFGHSSGVPSEDQED